MNPAAPEFARIAPDVKLGERVRLNAVINQRNSRAATALTGQWTLERITVRRGASIGSGALIKGSVTLGSGAVVLYDVPAGATVAGAPARVLPPCA